jgi:hypothetical protein
MRLALATLLIAASSSAAPAFCPIVPDDASTGYSSNATAHALCLQAELQRRNAEAAEKARIDAELGNIRIQLQRNQQLLMHRLQQPVFTPPI